MEEVTLTVTQSSIETRGPGKAELVLRTEEISKVSIPLSLDSITLLEKNLDDAKLFLSSSSGNA